MKKKFLYVWVLMLMLNVGCSGEEVVIIDGENIPEETIDEEEEPKQCPTL